MASSPSPTFNNPPVSEVVASVQFEPIPDLTGPRLGILWQRFRHEYPRTESHPALPPSIERLGLRAPLNALQVEFGGNPAGRTWFVNQAGDQLLQIQNDRFTRNWRRVPNQTTEYPRWEQHVRPRFVRELEEFINWLRDEKLGAPVVNQIEVAYINHILMNDIWRSHADAGKMLKSWAEPPLPGLPVEAVNLQSVHLLTNASGEFLGRLHVTLQSVFTSPEAGRAEDQGVFLLSLSARGKPDGEGMKGILAFLELGHAAVVSTFDKITTEAAHTIWQKQPSATHH